MGSLGKGEKSRPHAVCVPFPAQGHINPTLKLAKLLHHRGFHITFVNTEFNHQVFLKTRGTHALDGLPAFRFETIPDGLPPSNARATEDIPLIFDSTSKNCLAPFRELLVKLSDASSSPDIPPVTCIVSDFIMSFTLEAAEELGIPNVLFWTASACSFMGFLHYGQLIEKGFTPLKDWSYLTNGYLDTVIDWIPGMKGIRLKDLPTFIRTTDPNDPMLKFAMGELEKYFKSSPQVIFNTYDTIEHEILDALSTMLPAKIYSVGPIHHQLKNIKQSDTNSIGLNLWKDEPECLAWLDSKEPNSVVYVNFGTTTIMSPDQLVEFTWGLANSNQTFLWIIRPDLVTGDTAVLPPDLVKAIEERSLLASWCSQEQVLGHPSIGGFLTHNGWNSTLESIICGVPMICWPFFADQQTNCWYCCTQWGIGMEINSDVKRDEVENLVKELMVGEKGKKMKEKAMEWKKLAEEAITPPAGSSFVNFEEVVTDVLLSNVNF